MLLEHVRQLQCRRIRAMSWPLIASGEIIYTEDVTHGPDQVGDIILSVQKGTHKGKAVVLVAEEESY